MENKEDEYRAYINKIEAELEGKAQKYGNDMQEKITAYYKDNNYDKTDFISGRNSDFMQATEWSLANVKKIIEAISKAVFGGGAAVPDGTTVKKVDLGKSIAELTDLEAYVAGKCFEVLGGIVESFGSSSTVSFNSSYKSQPLGNGMHLFATVVCDSYKSQSFFENQEIYQYLYIYEVKYSVGEAQSQAKEELTQLYEDQITTFTAKVENLLAQLQDDKITPEQYESNEAIYNELIAKSTAALAGLREKKAV
jgi:hypothetical protein